MLLSSIGSTWLCRDDLGYAKHPWMSTAIALRPTTRAANPASFGWTCGCCNKDLGTCIEVMDFNTEVN